MFTFETKDMDILRNRALNRMEQLEMQQSGAGDELGYAYGNTQQVYTNTGYSHFLGIEERGFGRQNCQFQLPQAKLRNSYVKATFISCLIAVAVCLFFGVGGMLYTKCKRNWNAATSDANGNDLRLLAMFVPTILL